MCVPTLSTEIFRPVNLPEIHIFWALLEQTPMSAEIIVSFVYKFISSDPRFTT